MKRHIYSEAERKELESNENILRVTNSQVEFKEEFKSKVLQEREQTGKSAKQMFAEAGIASWLNIGDYAKENLKRWKKQAQCGEKPKRGRPKMDICKPISEMSIEELQLRIAYLELENEFLKKLEPLEQYKTSK